MQDKDENKTRNAAWEQYKLDKRYKFLTGIYLSAIAIGLIFLIVFTSASQDVKQVLVAIIAMLVLVALDAFKQCTSNSESNVFIGEYVFYDNRRINDARTINNYTGDIYHNSVETVTELQRIVNEEEASYLKNLPVETVAVLEEPEKQKVAEKAIERIESNSAFKQRLITALKAGAFEAMLPNPILDIVLATIEGWKDVDSTERSSPLSQNRDRESVSSRFD